MLPSNSHEARSVVSLELSEPCCRFTFYEIQQATNYFDESLVIGRGGFGKVYKGTISDGERRLVVAIKRLDSTSNQGAEEFWAEVEMLSKLRHCHLVSLIGYCNDGQEMILIYEYMRRGTLEDHLHKRATSLPWLTRIKICLGAARGLDYLHTGTGITHGVIHRDIKSSNILIDSSWAAKISDFGLTKICPINQQSTYVNTVVKGTFGYLDPDYFYTGKITRKSDVYAFGVVLFEVLCGKQAVDGSLDEEEWGLARWAQNYVKEGRINQIVDSSIRGRISPKCLKEFARIADRCLHTHPKHRPTMAEVVFGLESILASQEKANTTWQPARGVTVFGRKVPMFVFTSNGKNSDLERSLKFLELHFDSIQGENPIFSRFDFNTINIATTNFSDANEIDRGYCFIMYKGRLQNGHDIAISKLTRNTPRVIEEYMNEASILAKLEHDNLVKLLGYCINGSEVFLIYDFVHHSRLDHLSRLAEAARGMLSEFENAVLREPSHVPVPGGTIHPLTRYVMNYISLISDYKITLGGLIVSNASTGSRNSGDSPTGPEIDFSEHEEQSPLALHLIWIIAILQFNLEGKSKHYKDNSLAYLFIMNNVHYIVQKIKGSQELREMIGDHYLRTLTRIFRQAATNHQRATWIGVLHCLREQGLHSSGSFSSGVSRSALRERFKSFNAIFDEVHRTQALWLVPDEQLREELRISILEKLIPAYRSFLGRYRNHKSDNYIKYTVEDLENAVLQDLFEGYAVSQHSRRRSQ